MKPIAYFDLKEFAKNASGCFSFYNMTKAVRDRMTAVWSDEDFDFSLWEVL